ncbi:MAG: HRDC domain-containing protein [Culturomica sp.]|nr:HRDC domain-containing protein [Culturomica sp.]
MQKILSATLVDEQKLQERIASACAYFTDQLQAVAKELKRSPASTDSKANAMEYNDDLKTVYAFVEEKLHIFRKICEPANLPLYLVSSTRGLTELATYLPLTLEDLKQISGFGPATIAKYGQSFLDVVTAFCKQHNLESHIHEIEKKGGKKARKKKTKSEKK